MTSSLPRLGAASSAAAAKARPPERPASGPSRAGTHRRRRTPLGTTLAAAGALALAACASAPEPQADLAAASRASIAGSWQTALPHGGDVGALARWWQQFDDPALSALLGAADRASPSLATAEARIAQARAARVAAGAALLPSADATASLLRGRQDLTLPLGTSATVGLQASWELDVFGAGRAGRSAADARLAASEAAWHDARVAVAAETANTYVSLRACEAQLEQTRIDAQSRAETARLTRLSTDAGFESRANEALARAGAAQASSNATQQRQRCDSLVKALVELTALPEPQLRDQLAGATARLPAPAALDVPSVPATALAQRPDVFAAAQNVVAAAADVGRADALRYPRFGLAGSIGASQLRGAGIEVTGTTWTLGPVSVSVPVFDAGVRRANVEDARARYAEATASYAATLRRAIREAETALVTLQASAERRTAAAAAVEGFAASFRAVEARYRSGFGSLFELEDARRNALTAQNALIELDRERVAAWITLYRALGGGWTAEAPRLGDAAAHAAARDAATPLARPAVSPEQP
ncbi:efflux transporter outer membrane subunit [Piscinibacter koreensis]|uniref:Efflux transporter outer membrane subunit n=1 Tax=Piscinibacter koreensis TaxID=2742824 RepID=A0A7Y6NJJ4_9BURK|nr:efflux transporter outer membrane subunit [Schlegelella koreensis]NUZ04363.1 efflux transporter outer membrane subunit [Schlegelella koreensis]